MFQKTFQRLVRSHYSTSSSSIFSSSTITSKLPKVNLAPETTLGEIYDSAVKNYKYKMAYPVLLWVGFLYYNLWVPYMPEAEKKKLKERQDHLKSLEFHQL